MEIMPIDRQNSILPMSYLEQGFDINIIKSGESKPVMVRIGEQGIIVTWKRRRVTVPTSDKAIAKMHEWLGYEHLSFYPVFDESPD